MVIYEVIAIVFGVLSSCMIEQLFTKLDVNYFLVLILETGCVNFGNNIKIQKSSKGLPNAMSCLEVHYRYQRKLTKTYKNSFIINSMVYADLLYFDTYLVQMIKINQAKFWEQFVLQFRRTPI